MSDWMKGVYDKTFPGLEKALDLQWRRNEAITSNIANAETPAYRATDLNFAGELERAFGTSSSPLMATNAKHMDINGEGQAHLVPDYKGATKPDGNNVDIDIEMGRLAQNSGKYSITANLIRRKLQDLKEAIRSVTR